MLAASVNVKERVTGEMELEGRATVRESLGENRVAKIIPVHVEGFKKIRRES